MSFEAADIDGLATTRSLVAGFVLIGVCHLMAR